MGSTATITPRASRSPSSLHIRDRGTRGEATATPQPEHRAGLPAGDAAQPVHGPPMPLPSEFLGRHQRHERRHRCSPPRPAEARTRRPAACRRRSQMARSAVSLRPAPSAATVAKTVGSVQDAPVPNDQPPSRFCLFKTDSTNVSTVALPAGLRDGPPTTIRGCAGDGAHPGRRRASRRCPPAIPALRWDDSIHEVRGWIERPAGAPARLGGCAATGPLCVYGGVPATKKSVTPAPSQTAP